MRSLSKRKKRSMELNAIKSKDRITDLPSCLITKILSCLPTKDAVATSVLSKKWRRSWYYITKLDICDRIQDFDFRKFTSFVNRVLLLRDRSLLERIRMRCSWIYDDSLVNAWLVAILQCNVQELDITINTKKAGLLPSDMFLSNTLTVLKLDVDGYVDMPTSVCLPGLRTLHLKRVQLSNDVSIINLLSGCPLLEDLSLSRCFKDGVRVVNIIARVLKRLSIKYLSYDSKKDYDYQFVIDTPSLEYFDFWDYVPKFYEVNNMDHLIKAKIAFNLFGVRMNGIYQYSLAYSKAINDFLGGISQVESLVLSLDSMEAICSCNYVLPRFGKLTHLDLQTSKYHGGVFLANLLQNSPCLETLDVTRGYNLVSLPLHGVPPCFLCHLKKIKVDVLLEDEIGAIDYILKNARVLEELILHCFTDDAVFSKKLLLLPRFSANCQVVLL